MDTSVGMSTSGEAIFAWLRVLEELTYYELFSIASEARDDEVRKAFHEFCDTFHPDRHVAQPPAERQALSVIFKRGTEAYVVLTDAALRSLYDSQLAVRPGGLPQRMSFSPLSRPPSRRSSSVPALDEAVRSSAARPFARRAQELMRNGDLRQAKLQLVLANHRDPGNETIQQALRDVEAKLGSGA